MKSKETPKKRTSPVGYTPKTKDDFLLWLKKQQALKKQAEEQNKSSD